MRISAEMKADMDWWSTFAHTWNGRATFLESTWTPSPAFQLFTDASDSGFGCFWQGRWRAGTWTLQQRKRDIQWRELFAVLVAATAWGPHWTSKRLLVHCDNRAVVDIWRVGTSKQPSLMTVVRALFFVAARANFTVLLQHILGVDNAIADALSRSQLHRFRLLAPGTDELPTPIPAVEISTWPIFRNSALLHPPVERTQPAGNTTSPSAVAMAFTRSQHSPLLLCTRQPHSLSPDSPGLPGGN